MNFTPETETEMETKQKPSFEAFKVYICWSMWREVFCLHNYKGLLFKGFENVHTILFSTFECLWDIVIFPLVIQNIKNNKKRKKIKVILLENKKEKWPNKYKQSFIDEQYKSFFYYLFRHYYFCKRIQKKKKKKKLECIFFISKL